MIYYETSTYHILDSERSDECIDFTMLCLRNLNSGIFRPLKHKPPFSPTIRKQLIRNLYHYQYLVYRLIE
ncbi:hypothetical protein FWK35_00002204 [Aphis craccivora]|uniref:Uncharacterized protein n=1 Tax=Aphis craccivora TaxID=307492 RepID=A0A6G0ZNW9_APHCR|nr:hypothetical protein FWK35_00002204 [Aphis craccivora]